jgi:hypothetical protein
MRPQWLTMRVGAKVVFIWPRLVGMIGEEIVESAHPGAQTAFRRMEHMFVRLRAPSDGSAGFLQVCLHQR